MILLHLLKNVSTVFLILFKDILLRYIKRDCDMEQTTMNIMKTNALDVSGKQGNYRKKKAV